ncbi:hypothetical protein LXA43DRAFT_899253 [Ganoderma leucocontextum]|nr:hypothetical protein LXA43DRAFT_899253 [Ganoderma leucocontextum]
MLRREQGPDRIPLPSPGPTDCTKEKLAFLQPFGIFYDALAYSRNLHGWHHKMLNKSQEITIKVQQQQRYLSDLMAAVAGHQQQQERFITTAIQRQLAPMQEVIHSLHKRIDDLEHVVKLQSQLDHSPSSSGTASNLKTLRKAAKANRVAPTAPHCAPPRTHPPISRIKCDLPRAGTHVTNSAPQHKVS